MDEDAGPMGRWTVDDADDLARLWPGATFAALGSEPFHADVRRRRLDGSFIEGIAATPYRAERTPEQVRAHPRLETLIHVVVRGRADVTSPGGRFSARAGDVFLLAPGTSYAYVCPDPSATFRASVEPSALPPGNGTRSALPHGPLPTSELTSAFAQFAYALLRPARDALPLSASADRHLEAALTVLERGVLAESGEPAWPGPDAQRRRRDVVLGHLERNLADPDLGAESIAREFSLSVRAVHNLFALLPETLGERIRRRRVEEAATLLRTTERSVAQIATAVGFRSQDTFGRAFKRAYGRSANDYRRSHDDAGPAFGF